MPAQHRLRRASEFSSVVRGGRRSGRGSLVVHVSAPRDPQRPVSLVAPGALARPGPARLGLVVSAGVGGSVVRHRVSRRLRHVAAPLLRELPAGTDLVVRALPAAATAGSAVLDRDLRAGLRRLGLLGGAR